MTLRNGTTGRAGKLLRRWCADWIGGPSEEQMQQETEALSDEWCSRRRRCG